MSSAPRSAGGRPRVKVCGVTRVVDALLAVELGAALIGVNFYRASPRHVGVETAREIADAVRGRALVTGVFVDQPAAEVERIRRAVGLDLVQLHGDEDGVFAGAFGGRFLKAFRAGGEVAAERLAAYPGAWGFLFDAPHSGVYGGTGRRWEWGRVARLAGAGRTLIAGGIDADNVVEAAAASGAWGIDVCSGVEASPGIKDAGRLERLFRRIEEVGDGDERG